MPTALVVDDHLSVQELYTLYLQEEGFTVEGAATGAAAIASCLHARPDVALLDMRLPDMTGLDVLRAWGASGLPGAVFVVSGCLDPSTRAEALQLGAKACFEKPFRLTELQTALHTVVPACALERLPDHSQDR